MRLIDADVLKADYGMAEDCKNCKTGYRSCEYDRIYSKMDFCGWLDDAPTVDAVQVVHGHWIDRGYLGNDNRNYMCSVCGAGETHTPRVEVRYCWNCGARMDGRGNGNGRS